MVSESAGFIRLFNFLRSFSESDSSQQCDIARSTKKGEGYIKYEKSQLGQRHIVFALVMTPAGTALAYLCGQCSGGPGGRRGADCRLVYNLRGFSCLRSLAGLGG